MLANSVLQASRDRANQIKIDRNDPKSTIRSDYAEDEVDIRDNNVMSMYKFKKGSEKIGFKAMKIE